MEAHHIEKMLQELGCDKIKQGNTGWVYATCPLARWRHPSGADSKPSFAVSIAPDGASHYKCHACNAVGELPYLIWKIARSSGRDLMGLLTFVQAHNTPSVLDLKERSERSDRAPGDWLDSGTKKVAGVDLSARAAVNIPLDVKLPTLPETALDGLRAIPDDVFAYLIGPKRRLTPESVKGWELGWNRGVQRVAIPIRACDGALVGISGRAFLKDQLPKYLHSSGFRRDYYLYGEHKIRKGVRGYLCEGFFDVIYLHQFGYNAVAMMGSHLSKFQIGKIVEFFSEIVIVPDGDAPGYEAAAKAEASLTPRMTTTVANVPYGKDPDELDLQEMIEILGPS